MIAPIRATVRNRKFHDSTAREIFQALGGKPVPGGYLVHCPVPSHGSGRGDRSPSLSVADGRDGRLLVRCHGGCDPVDVLRELWGPRPNRRPQVMAYDAFAKDIRGTASSQDECAQDEAARIAVARAIRDETVPIDGRPSSPETAVGQAYLASRGIDRFPDGVARWHEGGGSLKRDGSRPFKNAPALVFVATTLGGELRAVQVLYFGPDGKPMVGKKGKKSRYTFGVHKDAALRLPGEGGLLATESSEDALSLWLATGQPVLAAFGDSMFGKLPVPDGAKVVLVCDNDDTHDNSLKSARKAADAFTKRGCRVSIAMPPDGVKKPNGDAVKDSNDLLVARGADAVRAMVAAAVPYVNERNEGPAGEHDADDREAIRDNEFDAEIKKLASLSLASYVRVRITEGKKLRIPVSFLDKLVAAERPSDESTSGQGRPIELPDVVPWDEPVNGDALLSELTAAIARYVILPPGAALIIALWALHSYVFDCFQCTPRLAITAPTKGCGKTLLLDVIRALVQRAFPIANITAAATFRMVELCRPTLLVDEADSFLPENEELRGILNSGHRCGGQVVRTVGDDHEPRAFSTHAPCAIALIGKLPSTLDDRSVHIEMRRKIPDEKVASFRLGHTPDLDDLARKAARWATDNAEALRGREPKMPSGVENRKADNWESLFVIADAVGGKWPSAIRETAVEACIWKEDESQSIRLLADIRAVFHETNVTVNISSADLAQALVDMPDKGWSECNRGKPLTQNGLARKLKPFGVYPKNIRVGAAVPKCYEICDFDDAFARYLPITPFQTATSATNK
jgi:putative DNA primase/helicase